MPSRPTPLPSHPKKPALMPQLIDLIVTSLIVRTLELSRCIYFVSSSDIICPVPLTSPRLQSIFSAGRLIQQKIHKGQDVRYDILDRSYSPVPPDVPWVGAEADNSSSINVISEFDESRND